MGYIAFDLDGTLAVREKGDSIFKIGAPISRNIQILKDAQARGVKVKIITARSEKQYDKITKWLEKQGITGVEITNKKCSQMSILFDDRAMGVLRNDGTSHIALLKEAAQILEKLYINAFISGGDVKAWLEQFKKAKTEYDENLASW